MQIEIVGIINQVGLPVAAAAAMFELNRRSEERHMKQVVELKKEHAGQLQAVHDDCEKQIVLLNQQTHSLARELVRVVQENTKAVTILCEAYRKDAEA